MKKAGQVTPGVEMDWRAKLEAEIELRKRLGQWGGLAPRWEVTGGGEEEIVLQCANIKVPFIRPLEHQKDLVYAPQPYKAMRWGRRAGKTRVAWWSAIVGHGPEGTWSQGQDPFVETWTGPLHRGILSGKDVVWVGRDHKQANVIWFEEIQKTFAGVEHATVHGTERYLRLGEQGTLWIRSADNMASIKGIGANLIGIIVDEAAYLDLESALKDTLLPALMDNEGWLIVMSTPNAGRDGNEERPAGPSFFNILCTEIETDLRDKSIWYQSHKTARDNPRITSQAFARLKGEYTEGSASWLQEGEAQLLKGLHGVMFSRWRDDLHIKDYNLTELHGWLWRAGLDDGFASPGSFTLGAFGPNGEEHLHAMLRFNGYNDTKKNLGPREVGRLLGRFMQQWPLPDRIDADSQMWADTTRGVRGISIAEEVQAGIDDILGPAAPRLWRAAKGQGSIAVRVRLFSQSLDYTEVDAEDEEGNPIRVVPAWGRPKFSAHSRCKSFIMSVPSLPVSPVNADIIDDTAYTHDFDSWTYLTRGRIHHPSPHEGRILRPNQHPGLAKYILQQSEGSEQWEPRWQRERN